jgi:hypothetical protein
LIVLLQDLHQQKANEVYKITQNILGKYVQYKLDFPYLLNKKTLIFLELDATFSLSCLHKSMNSQLCTNDSKAQPTYSIFQIQIR